MQLSLCGCAAPVYFALSLNFGAVNFLRASPESKGLFEGCGALKHEFCPRNAAYQPGKPLARILSFLPPGVCLFLLDSCARTSKYIHRDASVKGPAWAKAPQYVRFDTPPDHDTAGVW